MLIQKTNDAAQQYYSYHSTAIGERDVVKDMTLFWAELFDKIDLHRENGSWNIIVFECWMQDGYILAYPQKMNETPDKKQPELQLTLDHIDERKKAYDLPENQSNLRQLIELDFYSFKRFIARSYRKEPSLAKLKKCLENNRFRIYAHLEDDVLSGGVVELFF